jgi:hypothetical protein
LQSGPKDGPKLAAKEDKHLTRFSRRVAKQMRSKKKQRPPFFSTQQG